MVALGGLAWVSGFTAVNPSEAAREIRSSRPLDRLHTFLQNKWYWDELYQVVFIKPVIYFSEVIVYEVDGQRHH